ncbi:MAG: hypothetical protein B6U97_02110 [Candidatus Altiarchaeales archaeon ex4484_96]|nr:MAG: hypothetical protein B6U97_02110 [Candidatus Altiarchaeales archaeon ex4484_96]
MDENKKINLEKDIIDWTLIMGQVTESDLIKKFEIKKNQIKKQLLNLENKGVIKKTKSFNKTRYAVNRKSPAGVSYLKQMRPSKHIRYGKKEIETNLDILSNLVDRFDVIPLDKAARFFNTNKHAVMNWARILQEQDMISIHYPLMGTPLLSKKNAVNKKIHEKKYVYIIFSFLLALVVYLISVV